MKTANNIAYARRYRKAIELGSYEILAARELWRGKYDTASIASIMGFPEASIWNAVEAIRGRDET